MGVGKAVGIGCAVAFVLVLVLGIGLIAAVTFLGTRAETKVSEIGTEINEP